MWCGLLGPLICADETGREIILAGVRQRILLASLVLHADTPVSLDSLAEFVWDGAPPRGAAATLRSHIRRLRAAMGVIVGARITARSPGYLIHVRDAELDVTRFEALCQDAGAARLTAQWPEVSRAATRALALWRGAPLLDVPSHVLRERFVPRLEQLRLQALEDHVEAELNLFRHDGLVSHLRDLTARFPLRERFQAQLMLALYRTGRQAEALAVYQHARQVLVAELGVEPGPDLQDMHRRILAGDATAIAPSAPGHIATAVVDPPAAVVPRQLPTGATLFTGRAPQLRALTSVLARNDAAGDTGAISTIVGIAGVGKTTLAVQWARHIAGEFPDGQLFVNLHGFAPSNTPVSPADAVRVFLDALGVPAHQLPPTLEGQLGLYRSLLAGKRMLVVLDNARDETQVRPLLPGSPTCRVIVTSRNQLLGLTVLEAAHPLTLDVLTAPEAYELLRHRLSADRVGADPEATARIVAACAHLPLALSIVAARAATRPDLSLTQIAADLGAHPDLDAFADSDDPLANIRAAFSWSYQQLDADTARVFRLAGLHPGPELERFAVAALADTTPDHADRALAALVHASVIRPIGRGRYCMHDLLRGYARELTANDGKHAGGNRNGHGERLPRASLTRLFDYYLSAAATAMDTAFPAERYRRPGVPGATTPLPRIGDEQAALAWLAAELPSLVAVAAHTAEHGWAGHTTRLSQILSRYLDTAGHYTEARVLHGHARRAAHRVGDIAGEANALLWLGLTDARQGRHHRARDRYHEALALHGRAGDRAGQAGALNHLGLSRARLGQPTEGIRDLQRAVALFRVVDDRVGEAYALSNLGVLIRRRGNYQHAADYQRQALALLREIGDRHGEATVLSRLGMVEQCLGRHQQAIELHERAMATFNPIGDLPGQASTLTRLGMVALRQGHYRRATDHLRQALARFRELSDQTGEAEALTGLGEVLLTTGHRAEAREHYTEALAKATRCGTKLEQAHAHHGLANTYQAAGNAHKARHHWHEALAIYTDLDAPEADQVRSHLR